MKFIKELKDIRKKDFNLAGGKGTNLGEMIHAGLEIPPGFVLLTPAYEMYVKKNKLQVRIDDLISGLDLNNHEALDQASEAIGQLFMAVDLPGEIKREIELAYEVLGNRPVAIRSSATAEDLPGTSFAGQYDTYLNITGIENVYENIKKCFASLWNDRALAYRIKNKVPHAGLAHGVVVQLLAAGDRAGILFTSNPVNNRDDEILINASWGLGEAVVSGEVSPDQWSIKYANGEIVERYIAKKEVMTVRTRDGVKTENVPTHLQEKPVLSHAEIKELASVARKCEAYFGEPQDMEWVIMDNKLYLVQARPITSLYPVDDLRKSDQERLKMYMCFNLIGQQVNEPFTPLGIEYWRLTNSAYTYYFYNQKKRILDPPFVKDFGGRMYLEMSHLLSKKMYQKKLPNSLSIKDPLAGKILEQFIEKNQSTLSSQSSAFKISYGFMKWGMSMLKPYKLGKKDLNLAKEKCISEGENYTAKLQLRADNALKLEEKLKLIEATTLEVMDLSFKQMMYCTYALNAVEKADKEVKKLFGDRFDLEAIRHAIDNNPTTEMGMALQKLAMHFQKINKKPHVNDKNFKSFLKAYGHRSTTEIDMGFERWDENPAYILELINSYIDSDSARENYDSFIDKRKKAETVIDALYQAMEKKKGKSAAEKIKKIYMTYRTTAGLRERPKFDMVKSMQILRYMMLKEGDKLVKEGQLESKYDICFLRFKELRAGKNLRALAAQAKEDYEKYKKQVKVPRFVTNTGECFYSPKEKLSKNSINGIAVSAGTYEGRVKVVFEPKGADLKKGEILVTRSTNPAWTPLFLNAGALIMETGGPIAHGSIVAREYGIPAVVGVTDATSRLKDGQLIRVNGESGIVTLLDVEETETSVN